MTELHTHTLDGCTPTPLAGYLKALGMLRLLASAPNNIEGQAADPAARGWWDNERFHLRTKLDRDALLRFFLEDYAPSPIISPWNKGSGFYYQEGKTSEKDPTTGKKIKTGVFDVETSATRNIDAIVKSNSPRFRGLQSGIEAARKILKEELGTGEAPEGHAKAAFMDRYRSIASEQAAAWIDAALVTTGDKFDAAALLGSGGNDGNLDYSTAFHSAVLDILIPDETQTSSAILSAAIFDEIIVGTPTGAISQFVPGGIAAANSGNGFSGESGSDPWSIILMLEGTLAFAGAATTLGDVRRVRGSFPFTVSQSAGGSGAIGNDDGETTRAYELWLPLWHRPATFKELRTLLGEGRAHLGRERVRDGLTFARAVATLGTSRGVQEFQRLAFEARYGNMFITVPAGRFRVPEHRRKKDPIADLDQRDWLRKLRAASRGNAPARARTAIRQLDDALFAIAHEDLPVASVQKFGSPALRKALIGVGTVAAWLATSKEAREKDGRENILPPPRLGKEWVLNADDKSAEFRVAAALASLGWPDHHLPEERDPKSESPESEFTSDDDDDTAEERRATSPADETSALPVHALRSAPMAAHFAPINEASATRPVRHWLGKDSPSVVWGAGGLVKNMIAVLERRLIEQSTRGLEDKALSGASPARLEDVAAFLQGPPFFDDARCAALLAGLIWAQPMWLASDKGETAQEPSIDATSVPFAYAAIKPLFTASDRLREPKDGSLEMLPESRRKMREEQQFLSASARLPIPPGLIARLRRKDVGGAIESAVHRMRASGLASPFAEATNLGASLDTDRLAAALLIPINDYALTQLMKRAYPKPEDKGEPNTNTEEHDVA